MEMFIRVVDQSGKKSLLNLKNIAQILKSKEEFKFDLVLMDDTILQNIEILSLSGSPINNLLKLAKILNGKGE